MAERRRRLPRDLSGIEALVLLSLALSLFVVVYSLATGRFLWEVWLVDEATVVVLAAWLMRRRRQPD